jgi:chromosome segregation ATPase
VVGDAGALPFADATFDLLVCFEVIEHLLRPRRLLEEVRRTLRPDGTAVVSTPNRLVTGEPSRFHVTEYSPEEYADLVRTVLPRARVVAQRSLALSEVEPAVADLDGADYLLAVDPPEIADRAGPGRMAVRLAEVEREFQSLLDHYVDLVGRVDADRTNLRQRHGELEQELAGVEADRRNLRQLLDRQSEDLSAVEQDRSNLRQVLEGAEEDRSNLRHVLEGAEADRANLRQALTGVEEDRANLRQVLVEVEEDRRNLRELLAEVEGDRDRLQAATADLEARLTAAGEEQSRLQGALDAVTRDLETVLGSRSWRLLRALGIARR